jgi:hypothetical protein
VVVCCLIWDGNVMESTNERSPSRRLDDVSEDLEVEWVSDKSSKNCVLCLSVFTTLKRRRHHCRKCGRLVCGTCSKRKLVLNGKYGQTPQRVCDGCFLTLTQKKIFKEMNTTRREKEEAILNSSSYVSDSLIRIFLLDGSSLTVSYDSSTTAADLVGKVCHSVNLALFQVQRDIRDPDHFTWIPHNEYIANIIMRWTLTSENTTKMLIPVYDLQSLHQENAPSRHSILTKAMDISNRALNQSVSGGGGNIEIPENWVPMTNNDNQNELDNIMGSLGVMGMIGSPTQNIRESNNTSSGMYQSPLKGNSFMESGLPLTPQMNGGLAGGGTGSYQESYHETDSPNLKRTSASKPNFLTPTKGNETEDSSIIKQLKEEIRKLNRKNELLTHLYKMRVTNGNRNLRNPSEDNRESYDEFNLGNMRNSITNRTSLLGDSNTFEKSPYFSKFQQYDSGTSDGERDGETEKRESLNWQSEGESEVEDLESVFRKLGRNNNATTTRNSLNSRTSKRSSRSSQSAMGSTTNSVYNKNIDQSSDSEAYDSSSNTNFHKNGKKVSGISPQLLLLSPSDLADIVKKIEVDSENFQQLSRVFFHQIHSAENFFTKFQVIIQHLMQKFLLQQEQERVLDLAKQQGQQQGASSSSNTNIAFTGKIRSSTADETLIHQAQHRFVYAKTTEQIFEMTWVLHSLYSFVMQTGEDWYEETRGWVLDMLRVNMVRPLKTKEILQETVRCAIRIDLLYSPAAISIICAAIDNLFLNADNAAAVAAAGGLHETEVVHSPQMSTMNRDLTSSKMETKIHRSLDSLNRILIECTEAILPIFPCQLHKHILDVYEKNICQRISGEIRPYCLSRFEEMPFKNLAIILSFIDKQNCMMADSGGREVNILNDFQKEIMAQIQYKLKTTLVPCILRLQTDDTEAMIMTGAPSSENEVYSGKETTVYTNWPVAVVKTFSSYFAPIIEHLPPHALELVISMMIDNLTSYKEMQQDWLKKTRRSVKTLSRERLCAYINNNIHFTILVGKAIENLVEYVDSEDVASRIIELSLRKNKVFIEDAYDVLLSVKEDIQNDIFIILKKNMFSGNWYDKNDYILEVKVAIDWNLRNVTAWLESDEMSSRIKRNLLFAIYEFSLELIVLGDFKVSQRLIKRMEEDLQLWSHIYKEYFSPEDEEVDSEDINIINFRLNAWNAIIKLLSLDFREIPIFVRQELIEYFGPKNALKIWYTMMDSRNDITRSNIEGMTDIIIRDWQYNDDPRRQLKIQSFQDKLKTNRKINGFVSKL